MLPQLKGAVRFALENKTANESTDYWILVSLAELLVTTSNDPKLVTRAYKKALTASKKNTFFLNSSLGQLDVLDSLDFKRDYVEIGRKLLQEELDRISLDPTHADADHQVDIHEADTEELVFLFSGHMLDLPGADEVVFPAEMEEEARLKIKAALDKWQADANDLGITVGAAAGGDILFIEECLKRNMHVEVLLPYEEPLFLKRLVSALSESWTTRYYNIRNDPHVTIRMQLDHLGPVKKGDDQYMRNNRWGMYSALIRGIDKVRFLALWDGRTEVDTGYSAVIGRLVEDVQEIGARVEIIDTTKFSFFEQQAKTETKKGK
jgi:hypothetical protein